MTGPDNPLRIECVCTGNICRSPMAEVILTDALAAAGFADVEVYSSGIGGWHVGQPADPRALAELARGGYDGSGCRAEQISQRTVDADLVLALASSHRSELIAYGVDEKKVTLLRDFDPASVGQSVADPYYGGPEGFRLTREQIEPAAAGVVAWVGDHRADIRR